MAVPKFLQSALWSYELSRMDAKRHASTIIPQIFNYGLWDQIRWVLKTYPQRTIKKHIKNPARGMWYEDALVYWTTIFDIHPSRTDYARALFSLSPRHLPLPRKKRR